MTGVLGRETCGDRCALVARLLADLARAKGLTEPEARALYTDLAPSEGHPPKEDRS